MIQHLWITESTRQAHHPFKFPVLKGCLQSSTCTTDTNLLCLKSLNRPSQKRWFKDFFWKQIFPTISPRCQMLISGNHAFIYSWSRTNSKICSAKCHKHLLQSQIACCSAAQESSNVSARPAEKF